MTVAQKIAIARKRIQQDDSIDPVLKKRVAIMKWSLEELERLESMLKNGGVK